MNTNMVRDNLTNAVAELERHLNCIMHTKKIECLGYREDTARGSSNKLSIIKNPRQCFIDIMGKGI